MDHCHILPAKKVTVGDKVCFQTKSCDYVVEDIEYTETGELRHVFDNGQNRTSYWPDEFVYVEKK